MKCPFRAHVERVSAAKAGTGARMNGQGLAPAEHGAGASEYRLLLAALGNDLRQLSNTQSLERKIEIKRGLFDRYRDWVDGALSAEQPAQDEILGTMLVWSIDIGDWPRAMAIAEHVLRHGLTLPERYKRTAGTLIAEEVAEAGLTLPSTVDLATLQRVEALTAATDMPDQVRAKLKKATGLAFKAAAEAFDPNAESGVAGGKPALIRAAITQFERALALNSASGVKKLIGQLERELAQAASEKAE